MNLKIGQEVFIIQRDLTIGTKKIIAIINEEKEIKYKLDVNSCGGVSEKELFITKNKAEVVKQDFINNLKFIVGDLLIFKHENWSEKRTYIGRVVEITYTKNPYIIKTNSNSIYDITDESVVLKINNDYIENFGKLQELDTEFGNIINLFRRLEKLINLEYDLLEKDLKQKFKHQFSKSWFLKKKKPLFKDRFDYERNYDD